MRLRHATRLQGRRPGNIPAQGNALGKLSTMDKALKGRAIMEPPLQGFARFVTDDPGRCPGLVSFAPLVLGLRHILKVPLRR